MKGEKIIIFCFLAIFLMTASGLVNAINLSDAKKDEKIIKCDNLGWGYWDSFQEALGGRWKKSDRENNYIEQRCGFLQVRNTIRDDSTWGGWVYDANLLDDNSPLSNCPGLEYFDPSMGHELKQLLVQIDVQSPENPPSQFLRTQVELIAEGVVVPGPKVIDKTETNPPGGQITYSLKYDVPDGYQQKQTYGFQVMIGTGTSLGTWTSIEEIRADFYIDYKDTAIITEVSAPYEHTTKGGRQQAKIDITGFTTTDTSVKYYAENLQTGKIFLPINPDWDENEFYNFGKGVIIVKYDNKHDDIKVVAVSTTDPSKEDYEIIDMPWEKSLNKNLFKFYSFPILENLLKILQNRLGI